MLNEWKYIFLFNNLAEIKETEKELFIIYFNCHILFFIFFEPILFDLITKIISREKRFLSKRQKNFIQFSRLLFCNYCKNFNIFFILINSSNHQHTLFSALFCADITS
jgi:hypothetical protein